MKYKCPCCGYYTFDSQPIGNYDICPVCFWEDDPAQSQDETLEEGANPVSLKQARENYQKYGACTEEMLPYVRKPKSEELTESENSARVKAQ